MRRRRICLFLAAFIPSILVWLIGLPIWIVCAGIVIGFLGLLKRSWSANLIAVFASSCLAVALLDLPLRYWTRRPFDSKSFPAYPKLTRLFPGSFEGEVFGDLARFTAGNPADRDIRRVASRVDKYGFRNPDSDQAYNVLLLGDSFGVGSNTTENKTLAHRLKKHGFAVYNLSMPGSSPWHEFMNLQLELPRLKVSSHSVVLWTIFAGNDLDESYDSPQLSELLHNNWRGQLMTSLETFRNQGFLRQLLANRGNLHAANAKVIHVDVNGESVLLYKTYLERIRTREAIEAHRNFQSLCETVSAMRQFASDHQLTVNVVLIPSKEELYSGKESGWSEVLAGLSAENGMGFIDLTAPFRAAPRPVFWRDDTHWNEEGQALAAEVISVFLRAGTITGPGNALRDPRQ